MKNKIKQLWGQARLSVMFATCLVRGWWAVKRSRLVWWPVGDAVMTDPRTALSTTLTAGLVAQGITTILWGTKAAVTSIAGTANNGTTVGIVMRISQNSIVENMKYPNGDGPTITRVQMVDGQEWDVEIRDDTALGLPRIGAAVIVNDYAGHISTVGLKYTGTVIGNGYDSAPKTPGTRNFKVESLVLIESQTGA